MTDEQIDEVVSTLVKQYHAYGAMVRGFYPDECKARMCGLQSGMLTTISVMSPGPSSANHSGLYKRAFVALSEARYQFEHGTNVPESIKG